MFCSAVELYVCQRFRTAEFQVLILQSTFLQVVILFLYRISKSDALELPDDMVIRSEKGKHSSKLGCFS